MKALEKDRTRRYETANSLAMDVQRYLADEAVEACPPSAPYRFRKFARRNQAALATGATIAGILIVATAVSIWLALWALGAEKVASGNATKANLAATAEKKARLAEQKQRELAQSNEKKATSEATKSREVATFLKDMLNGVGPSVALGRDTKMLEEILEKTAERLDSSLSGQPDVEAELRETIGNIYEELGKFEPAEVMFRRAIELQQTGNDQRKRAVLMSGLGSALIGQALFSEAQETLEDALAIQRGILGDGPHAEVATTIQSLADTHEDLGHHVKAKELTLQALEMRKQLFGETHDDVANSYLYLGNAQGALGDFPAAQESYEEAVRIYKSIHGERHPRVASALDNLAGALSRQLEYDEAEKAYRKSLELRQALLGQNHFSSATTLNNLANIYLKKDRIDEADAAFTTAHQLLKASLGDDHPGVAVSLGNVARVRADQGRFDEAEAMYRESLAILVSALPNDHPKVGECHASLGKLLSDRGQYGEAEENVRIALEIQRKIPGKHPGLIDPLNILAMVTLGQSKWKESEHLYRELLELRAALHQDDPGKSRPPDVLGDLAFALARQDRFEEAEQIHREALELAKTHFGAEHEVVVEALWRFVLTLKSADRRRPPAERRYSETEQLANSAIDMMASLEMPPDRHLVNLYRTLGEIQLRTDRPLDAIESFEACLTTSQEVEGEDSPQLFQITDWLTRALSDAGNHKRALKLTEENAKRARELLGVEDRRTMKIVGGLAVSYLYSRQPNKAIAILEELLPAKRRVLGEDYEGREYDIMNLAGAYRDTGQFEMALPLFQQAHAGLKDSKGPNHPQTLTTMFTLAGCQRSLGKSKEALDLLIDLVERSKKVNGPHAVATFKYVNDLALTHRQLGNMAEAITFFRQAADGVQAKLPSNHPMSQQLVANFASTLSAAGKFDESITIYRELYESAKLQYGDNHPVTLSRKQEIANGLYGAERYGDAIPILKEVFRERKAKIGTIVGTWETLNMLGGAYYQMGQYSDAERVLSENLDAIANSIGREHFLHVNVLRWLQVIYLRTKNYEKAELTIRQWIEIQNKIKSPPQEKARATSCLASALVGLERYDEAMQLAQRIIVSESIAPAHKARAKVALGTALIQRSQEQDVEIGVKTLMAGIEEMENSKHELPNHLQWVLARAYERAVTVFTTLNRDADATAWQTRLDELNSNK